MSAHIGETMTRPTVDSALMAAAMRACDRWGDDDRRREEMRGDLAATPAHLRADLLAHLQQAYPTAAEKSA